MSIRIVCTSDNHLGRYYGKMNARQLAERRARLRAAFAHVVDFTIDKRAHFFLQCGDLFDRESPPPVELTFVAQQIQRLRDAGVRVYAISGNHDMPAASDGATPVRIFDELRAARVFTKRTEIEFDVVKVDQTRVAIGGIAPDPRLEPGADPLEGVVYAKPEADVALLMMHCGFEGSVPPGFKDAVLPRSRVAQLKGIDYYYVGDMHRTHRAVIDEATVVIPGATERMTFGECEEKTGFYYAELDGARAARLIHAPVEPQPMRRQVIRTTDLPAEQPTEYVFQALNEISDADQMLQLRIEGPVTREVFHRLRFFEIWRLGSELNFYFDLDRTAVAVQSESRNGSGGGEVVSMRHEIESVAEELAARGDGDERALLDEARDLILSRVAKEE